jgi:hypothetical protein
LTRFDHSRFLAVCAENNGFNIQAFTSYEEAMQWLLDDDTPRLIEARRAPRLWQALPTYARTEGSPGSGLVLGYDATNCNSTLVSTGLMR